MIVRAMKIDQIVAEILQDRQCSRRTVDKLARASGSRKAPLDNEIVLARFDSGLDKLRVELLQISTTENCLDRAQIRPGANERFVGTLAEQKLQGTDDDRFARASLSSDCDKPRRRLPLEFFHEREILNSQ